MNFIVLNLILWVGGLFLTWLGARWTFGNDASWFALGIGFLLYAAIRDLNLPKLLEIRAAMSLAHKKRPYS